MAWWPVKDWGAGQEGSSLTFYIEYLISIINQEV